MITPTAAAIVAVVAFALGAALVAVTYYANEIARRRCEREIDESVELYWKMVGNANTAWRHPAPGDDPLKEDARPARDRAKRGSGVVA